MRQTLYVSSKTPGHDVSVGNILLASQRNNLAAGVTGLLYTDGKRFLQVLEGDPETVTATFERIKKDHRHQAVVVLSDREVTAREFSSWSMAHRRPQESSDMLDRKIERLLSGASPSMRATFTGLISARRSA